MICRSYCGRNRNARTFRRAAHNSTPRLGARQDHTDHRGGPPYGVDEYVPMTEDTNNAFGPFVAYLGLRVREATAERVVATWDATPALHQPYGIVHGGVHCSVGESLASLGAALWMEDRGQVVGVNNNTDFLRAVRDESMTSIATPIHRGRSHQLWLVETQDESGRTCSRTVVRLQNLYAEPTPGWIVEAAPTNR